MVSYRYSSVLTLVRGRQVHLDHLIAGLKAQVRQPDELVIAYMQQEAPTVPGDCPFAIHLEQVDGDPMPLARARNRAAARASGDVLAFLDVDCIPDNHFVQRSIEAAAHDTMGVFLPEVRYLPAKPEGWLSPLDGEPDFTLLEWAGNRHPARPDLGGNDILSVSDYGELWGLSFILTRKAWEESGGMDESFVGYGAEETDFARRLKISGAGMYWLGGTICYHQHHSVHTPPLQHFDSIVRNARLFHAKWGEWCMDYWLAEFEKIGLVAKTDDELTVLRNPTLGEIDAAKQGPEVCFS